MTIAEISADTNILLDFNVLKAINLLFKLPYKYHISRLTYDTEITKPCGFKDALLMCGIIIDDLTVDELFQADAIRKKAPQLSQCDCLMLALAKSRGMMLATGDKNLRKTAIIYGVEVIGTIYLIDKLLKYDIIDEKKYKKILQDALNKNDLKDLRLPRKELLDRLKKY